MSSNPRHYDQLSVCKPRNKDKNINRMPPLGPAAETVIIRAINLYSGLQFSIFALPSPCQYRFD
jgi:hypothetical protein